MQIFNPQDILVDQRLAQGIAFAQSLMAQDNLAGGRHDLDGSDIFAIVIDYDTPVENDLFESHRKIIDLHMMISGTETIEVCDYRGLNIHTDYQEDGDYILYHPPADHRIQQNVTLHPDIAIAFYPEDAHHTGSVHGTPQSIRKIVVKIPL